VCLGLKQMVTNEVAINFNILGMLMKHVIMCNMNDTRFIVNSYYSRTINIYILKSQRNQRNSVVIILFLFPGFSQVLTRKTRQLGLSRVRLERGSFASKVGMAMGRGSHPLPPPRYSCPITCTRPTRLGGTFFPPSLPHKVLAPPRPNINSLLFIYVFIFFFSKKYL
jgi:hypothetical protein